MSATNVIRLEQKVRHQRETIQRKNDEIKRLKAALNSLLSQNESDRASSDVDGNGSGPEDTGEDAEMQDGACEKEDDLTGGNLLEPLFDEDSSTYYCTSCISEVVDGECFMCGLVHLWIVDENVIDDRKTETQAIHPDRSLVPRGVTPVRDIEEAEKPPPEYCASQYPLHRPCREQEYHQLRERGATRLMCETFHLEFSYKGGIYAWADPELFDEFSGQKMQQGDHWKIHLGRRVALDNDDVDGSCFIEGLLEDALLFPYRDPQSARHFEMWETTEESPGIWVTRLKSHKEDDEDDLECDDEDDLECDDEDDLECDKDDSNETDPESDEEDNLNVFETTYNRIDEALVNPPADDGPIRLDEYSFSEDDISEDDDYEMQDPGLAWHAGHPDRVWSSDEEEEENVDELDEDLSNDEYSDSTCDSDSTNT